MPLLGSQEYALNEVLDGLANDVHWFVVPKARQLGSTTLWLALSLFWCGLYPKLQGGIIADTEANKEETIRARIDEMIDGLPADYPLPLRRGRSAHNKNGIHFDNGSVIQYLVAGTRKGSGSLGRSRSLNFLLATEVAGYGDPDQVDTVKAALSDSHPNRLYIWESTAFGYNHFYDLCQDAEADRLTQRMIFVGWWQHKGYSYTEDDPLFRHYGLPDLTEEEEEAAAEVRRRWGYEITRGQWAWYRHHRNPQGGSEIAFDRVERFIREYPTTPEEAFRASGSPFVNPRTLGKVEEVAIGRLFKPYCYDVGEDFRAMRVMPERRGSRIDLKVWQEPVEGASYVVSADAAFASGEDADAYCAQVCRCYADRIEQVAEYHRRGIEPFQFTWILAHLCGLYVNVRLILEINGPGEAVMTEFRHMKTLVANGELDAGLANDEKRGNFLRRVKTYLYHRPDSFSSGYAIQWKTSANNRTPLLIGLSDQLAIGQCIINSVAAIDEIRRLRQIGSIIEPEGKAHDDRAMAMAMAVRAWLDWERAGLRAAGRTWESEHASPDKPAGDQVAQYLTYHVNTDLAQKARDRRLMATRVMTSRRSGQWNW